MKENSVRLFGWSAAVTAGPPLVALPFWIADAEVGAWSGSLGFYEVIAAPLALVLVAFTVYRRTRRVRLGEYLGAMVAASALGVGLWYLGVGLHGGTLVHPDPLTAELMGIAFGVQSCAALGASAVVLGIDRMRASDCEP